jgi:peptidoglycan hydrolase-like protein with peptidoglycan-binding domain
VSARLARRLSLAAAAGVVLCGAAWWTAARAGGQAGDRDGGGEVATTTAAVARRDLRATEEVDGTLGYGDTRTVANGRDGTITALPDEGAVVTRGHPLYRVDARPVPLLYGRLPAWRALGTGVDDGPDVRQLEQNLVALGYDPDRAITVDDHFSWATRAAVERWQEALGLEETGTVQPGDAVWQPGPVRVASRKAAVGDRAHPGSPVLEVTSTTRRVTIDLDASRQPYVKAGDRVDLELPGGRTATGRVVSVGKVATAPAADGAGGDDTPTVELVVSLDRPGATGGLDQAPVDASITTGVRKGVLAVPVGALLALAEGGYAVEVERDGRRRLVGVETGLFADGQVEVSGGGLRAGDGVVVPL